jgi:hypothetical protein
MPALTKEQQRERAHAIATQAMASIQEMLTEANFDENYEPGYDLIELQNGWLLIHASHDVRIYVDQQGEEQYALPHHTARAQQPLW